jgi:hypothetical protein
MNRFKALPLLLAGVSLTLSAALGEAKPLKSADQAILESVVHIRQQIHNKTFEEVLAGAQWDLTATPEVSVTAEYTGTALGQFGQNSYDECSWNPDAPGCYGDYLDPHIERTMRLKNDGLQILATEVLFQTLTYFKVKHVFGQIAPTSWGFKVVEPVEGAPFQDLDSRAVVYAVRQFRKYMAGLLCHEPNPARMLAMMNRFQLGERFRWDMAWALLGNDLPENPNRFMRFGPKWKRFTAAVDGIENGSLMKLRNLRGDVTNLDPQAAVQAMGIAQPQRVRMGFIAREVVGIIQLVGDVIMELLNLLCFTDLSVDQKKEFEKRDSVYKLLQIKKSVYERYNPLKHVLEELAKEAAEKTGREQGFLP